MTPLRWGFLGAAGIARKNWAAVRAAENCTLTAVASRDAQRAAEFIQACQATAPYATPPRVADSYEALLASPDIDAVYIPLPTPPGVTSPIIMPVRSAPPPMGVKES